MFDFERALRQKIRWNSPMGLLDVEALWELPLSSTNANRANLNSIAVALHKQLEQETISFVEDNSNASDINNYKLQVIKYIIEVKKAERKAALEAQEKAERKQKIMAIIADKREEGLKNMPLEELEKMLTE